MAIDKGLRARLRSGFLIGGQLYVAIEYFPGASKAKIDWTRDPPEFPVVPGEKAELQEKIRSLVAKLDKVPVEEIGIDVKTAVGSLDRTLQSATRTLSRVDEEILPEVLGPNSHEIPPGQGRTFSFRGCSRPSSYSDIP